MKTIENEKEKKVIKPNKFPDGNGVFRSMTRDDRQKASKNQEFNNDISRYNPKQEIVLPKPKAGIYLHHHLTRPDIIKSKNYDCIDKLDEKGGDHKSLYKLAHMALNLKQDRSENNRTAVDKSNKLKDTILSKIPENQLAGGNATGLQFTQKS